MNKLAALKAAPLPKEPPEYWVFDKFAWMCDLLFLRIIALMDVSADIEDDDPPGNLALEKAVGLMANNPVAMARECVRCWEYFERDELYTEEKKSRLTLTGGWTYRVIRRKIVAQQVAAMLGAFPNASPPSVDIYTARMITEIMAAAPSNVALESTCREIVRTKTFVPSIAEVLTVLEDKMRWWENHEPSEDDARHWFELVAAKIAAARPVLTQSAETPMPMGDTRTKIMEVR